MPLSLSRVCTRITPSATLRLNALVADMRAQGQDIISLAAGEPDFETPKNIVAAAVKAMADGGTYYTAVSGLPQLRQAICDYLLREKGLVYGKNSIIVGTGAKQVLYEALRAIVDEGDEVILPAPCWLSYAEMISMVGGNAILASADDTTNYVPLMQTIAEKITPRTKAVLINTPNNPTGAVWDEGALRGIAQFAQENDIWIISDEIYEKMVYDGTRHISVASLSPDAKERTIMISGFSKAYAMTGWRLGYAAGPASVIKEMDAYQSHATGNANSIAQYAGIEALNGPQDSVYAMVQAFERRRRLMIGCLKNVEGVKFVAPQGAFYVLLNVSACIGKTYRGTLISDDTVFSELLLENAGISVVPGTPFFAQNHVRLSYAVSDDRIVEGVRRLGDFVRETIS